MAFARAALAPYGWISSALSLLREPKVNMANKTCGTVSPERQKAMSGLDFVKGLASGALEHDRADLRLCGGGRKRSRRYHAGSNKRSPQPIGHGARRPYGDSSR